MAEHTTDPGARSTTALLADAMAHVSGLVRKEMDLVRAELSENAKKAAVAVGLVVGALVVIITALNVLSAALVAAIAELLGEDSGGWAALIVGVIYFVVALIMVKKGTNDLKATSLAPTRSARSVQKDAHAVKETVNG